MLKEIFSNNLGSASPRVPTGFDANSETDEYGLIVDATGRVALAVVKESNAWVTHPKADVTPRVAGRWWPRFLPITFCLQLLDTSLILYCYGRPYANTNLSAPNDHKSQSVMIAAAYWLRSTLCIADVYTVRQSVLSIYLSIYLKSQD